ncbi:MAG TPA: flippase-like domain-containing protein [Thermomicrobiaceae bacterium]|nr:flippase-like domain-containing protein [Thermomicrobiaceae bacterium]
MIERGQARAAGTWGRRWLLPLVVWGSVLLALAALALTGEAARMRTALSGADWWLLLPLLGAGLLLPVLHARRWCALLRAVGDELPLVPALELTVTATMVNYAAPGYLWSPAKGLLARQFHGIAIARSLPTLAAEQGLDALALLAGSLLGLAAVGPEVNARLFHELRVPSVPLLAAGGVVLLLLAAPAFWLVRRYARRFGAAVAASARMLARDRSQRVPILLLTAGRWLLDLAAVFLAITALGVPLGLGAAVLLSSLPLLIGQISPMPGGIGFREGAMAAIAAALGLPLAAILAAAVLHRAVLLAALPALLGLIRLGSWSGAWR